MTPEWVKTAKVGDKVVCIKRGKWVKVADGEIIPKLFPLYGAVYTITAFFCDDDQVFLRLEETNGGEFLADMFRPVAPRKTDISIFTRLLNTAPAMEEA